MSTKYKATEKDVAYVMTITTVGWIDVFFGSAHNYAELDSEIDIIQL